MIKIKFCRRDLSLVLCLIILVFINLSQLVLCSTDQTQDDDVSTLIPDNDSLTTWSFQNQELSTEPSNKNKDDDSEIENEEDDQSNEFKIPLKVEATLVNGNEVKLRSEEDYYEEENEETENQCSAQFFLDKLMPEDYPTEISARVTHLNETIERLNRMHSFSQKLKENWNPFVRELGLRFTDFLYESNIDPICMGSLFRVVSSIQEQKSWALSFFDAMGNILNNGYQEGKFVSLGEFDQCLAIVSEPEEDQDREPIRGQYCLIKPMIPLPEKFQHGETIANSSIETVNKLLNDDYIVMYLELFKYLKNTILRFGVCIPDKCSPADIEEAINKLLVRKTGLSVKVGPKCAKATDELKLDTFQVVSLFVFGILILLVFACSMYELIYRVLLDSGLFSPASHQSIIETPYSFTSSQHQHSVKFVRQASSISAPYTKRPLQVQVFTMFSIIRNTRVLFEIPAYRKLPLDTMKLILILFFFVLNSYMFTILFAPMILRRFYVLGPSQLAQEKKYFFIRMYYIVDIFLAYSGISLALSFKPKSFNYAKYVVHSYLRYAMPMLFSLGLIFVAPLLGSGPLWHLFDETLTQNCRKNLWSSLFMYNNLEENIEDICHFSSTFTSLTFQIQLIAPLFLIVAHWLRPKTGTIFLIVIFCIFNVTNLIPRYVFGYKVPYEHKDMKSFAEMKHSIMFYGLNPVYHSSSLLYGLIYGHVITRDSSNSKFSHTAIGGVISLIMLICGTIYVDRIDIFEPNLTSNEMIGLLTYARLFFLSFFCWIVYASVNNHFNIMKRFLSSIVWRPLASLSFGFYITSMIVIMYRLFSIREPTSLSPETMFRAIVSDAVVSFIIAYLIHIMVQQPMRNLRSILIHWKVLFDVDSIQTTSITSFTPQSCHYSSNIVFDESTKESDTNGAKLVGAHKTNEYEHSESLDVKVQSSDVNNN